MADTWELHEEPHRHYKRNGSWTSNGLRIASVTQVLEGDASGLAAWAAAQAFAASEDVANAPGLAERAALSPTAPDNVRDGKAALGTALHKYWGALLAGSNPGRGALPYGFCRAIEDFVAHERPVLIGAERAVGDAVRAVAGTYDAHVVLADGYLYRIDMKSGALRAKHWAQLAAYEHCAYMCGEPPSDYLSLLHIEATGVYTLHSIRTGGADHAQALAVFDAALTLYRGLPNLAKLCS